MCERSLPDSLGVGSVACKYYFEADQQKHSPEFKQVTQHNDINIQTYGPNNFVFNCSVASLSLNEKYWSLYIPIA